MINLGNYIFYKNNYNLLGKGAFSKVYRGKCIDTNKLVAFKIIKIKNITVKGLSIIEDEIKMMEIIKKNPHQNIVECYDIIKKNDKVYIIMEYCDSGNLRTILKKPIKESYTQFYFSQLANGLKYLNENNIIHRDIKPKNILLTNNRKVLKIADFGFARKIKEQSLYDTICGSPLYMAPEIMSNEFYNEQTDLWSIGIILYEMLYGYHPFNKCRSIPELKKIVNNINIDIPPINNTNINVSHECISLLKLLLKKNVNNRITWKDFFNNPWVNKYFDKNNKLKNSLENINCKIVGKIEIIDDYYSNNDSSINYNTNKQNDSCLFDLELDTNK